MNKNTKPPKDVVIGFPVYDARPELSSILATMASKADPNCCVKEVIFMLGDSLVTRARNKLVAKFLNTDADYLMFVDSDIKFYPNDINTLRSHNKGVIGGVYLKKKIPYAPVANNVISQEGTLWTMAEVGTGFMLIHRDVFTAIREMQPEFVYKGDGDEEKMEYYDYFRVGVVGERYLSEDYYFCALAREAGYDIYYDTTVFTSHIGKAVYPFKDADMLNACADLLDKYNTEMPLDSSILDSIEEGIKHQRKERNL